MIFNSTNFLLNIISEKIENMWQSHGIYEVKEDEELLKDRENQNFESVENDSLEEQSSENFIQEQFAWALKIPKINLYAEIAEGTEPDILNKYIGHFTESKSEIGNVCLAAHNRGYSVNYFADLKTLSKGDEIFYYINENEYKYKVFEILVIHETDWSVIENTEEDTITLITCIENREAYRLCVQGIKVE